MSDRTQFGTTIYSAKYGTDDEYTIVMERNQMTIGRAGDPNPSICTWKEGRDPTWSTDFPQFVDRNPVESTLENEHVYPPTIFVRALEAAWRAWRHNELNNEEVESEINALCEWINTTTKSRPKTDFWRRIF
jgi:hypothetical protein